MPFGLSGNSSSMFGLPPSRIRIFCDFPSPRRWADSVGLHRQADSSDGRRTGAGSVQLGDPATAIHPVCGDRTHKPGPLATEPARRPGDGDSLLDVAPILAIRAALVFQGHGMALGFDVDGRHLLAVPAPGQRKPPRRSEIAEPMPFQHIDGSATLDGILAVVRIARHLSPPCSLGLHRTVSAVEGDAAHRPARSGSTKSSMTAIG